MQLGNKGDREMRDEGGSNKGGKGWGNINGGGGGGGGSAHCVLRAFLSLA